MFTERIALTSLVLSSTLAGWSAFAVQRARLQRRFHAAGLRSYQATLENGQVHYWAGGHDTGRPLLLVHGFGGDALFGWGEQASLARDRFVILPDLLWFGESHSHVEDFTPAFQAETMRQLLDHLAIEKADVVGISYGGFVAGELAARHPARVGKLGMVDSPGHAYTLDDYHAALDRLGIDSIAELVVPDSPDGVRRLLKLAYHRPPPVPAFVARDVFAHMFVRWRREKIRLLDHLLDLAVDLDEGRYQLDHPAIVMWGSGDELFPVSLAYRLAHKLQGPTEVCVLPDANHAPNMERSLMFNARLAAFLARSDEVH
ncbi:MAG: alpha/beta fold hydrolase [Alphaproteobacteria bacterium]|nr:alpha/beta fold hydrolase [Alphaproteobacteria bacterium]